MTTSIVYPGLTGSQSNFTIPFEYLSRDHVKVTLDGVVLTSFSFLSASIIQMDTAPTGELRVYRETPTDESLVTWVDGSILLDDDLNTGNLQTLFVSEELKESSLSTALSGNWDSDNLRITNLADPISDQDAVNKRYFEQTFQPDLQALVDAASASSSSASSAAASATSFSTSAATSESNAASSASLAAASAAVIASRLVFEFNTKAELEAYSFTVVPDYVKIMGYSEVGDAGAPIILFPVQTEPTHPGKFQDATGRWWELRVFSVNQYMFGGNVQDMWDYPLANERIIRGSVNITETLVARYPGVYRGEGNDWTEQALSPSQITCNEHVDMIHLEGSLANNIIFKDLNIHGDGNRFGQDICAIRVGTGGISVTDAAMEIGSTTVTSPSNGFSSVEVGMNVSIDGAGSGGSSLLTKCVSKESDGEITLSSANASGNAVSGATGYVVFRLVNVSFEGVTTNSIHKYGLRIDNAVNIQTTRCEFRGETAAVLRDNVFHHDEGDDLYSDTNFHVQSGGDAAFLHKSGGGAKFSNCKTLGGINGYKAEWNSGSSANLIIDGLSMEDHSGYAIELTGTSLLKRVAITGITAIAGGFLKISGLSGVTPDSVTVVSFSCESRAEVPAINLETGVSIHMSSFVLDGLNVGTYGVTTSTGVIGSMSEYTIKNFVNGPTNIQGSLFVDRQAAVFAGTKKIASIISTNYTALHDTTGTVVGQFGSLDPRNYHYNTYHRFASRSGGGDIFMDVDSTGTWTKAIRAGTGATGSEPIVARLDSSGTIMRISANGSNAYFNMQNSTGSCLFGLSGNTGFIQVPAGGFFDVQQAGGIKANISSDRSILKSNTVSTLSTDSSPSGTLAYCSDASGGAGFFGKVGGTYYRLTVGAALS